MNPDPRPVSSCHLAPKVGVGVPHFRGRVDRESNVPRSSGPLLWRSEFVFVLFLCSFDVVQGRVFGGFLMFWQPQDTSIFRKFFFSIF